MPKIPKDVEKRISTEFQNRLLELMDDADLTDKGAFSKAVNISVPVINRAIIYGIIPSLKPLIKMADFFNVSLKYMLGEENENDFYKSENPVTFLSRLKALTAERNTTYAKIAHVMPFSKNHFYGWENTNTLPSLDYLKALADYFQVSADYLLGRTDYRD